MSSAAPATVAASPSAPYSAPQIRIIAAASELFAKHGVNGTSLQMIADTVGVTKAAVYNQFRSKEQIVVAVVEVHLARVETALDIAERLGQRPHAAEVVMAQVIEDAVAHRRLVSTLQHDPVVAPLLAGHDRFQRFMRRLYRVLVGDDLSTEARVRAAMIAGAIGGAIAHPFVAELDDESLRSELLRQTRKSLGVSD
jgi:AcrR family transcriptional regulator